MKPKKTQRKIPVKKLNSVGELSQLIKNKRTILITSIKNIPASQFQEIAKGLRGKAIVKVPKKNLIFRALDSSGEEAVKKLKNNIKEDVAILFSDLDCFDLAADLFKNKRPAKAKAGQEAPKDIEVQAGPTDLIPGPAISELGALGIEIQIEKGKIHIKTPKIIVKEGVKISANAAGIMNKLDIKPFSIGFIPLSAFDTKEKKIYIDININPEEAIEKLKIAYSKALPFAVEIGYPSSDTISFLIGKAYSHGKAIEKFGKRTKKQKTEEVKESEDKEKEENAQTKESKSDVEDK
ncbi:MAG: 50S ribosomal protein L10 [Nanoarchaeota archaeon]|nr:50S ribosomal protein L10 [Nanoarchaeota archaeon]